MGARPAYKRAMGWIRLVKLWVCMRKDDMLAIDPMEMRMTSVGLTMQNYGPRGGRHRIVEAYVARGVSLTGCGWLGAGYEL
eukprot:3860819-Amphidinium_carterae.1